MKSITVAVLAVLIAAEVAVAASPESPEVWMAVLPVEVLGKENAAWDYVQHHLDGLKFWQHQIDGATVEQLRPLVRLLTEHDIDIVIENNPPWPGPVDEGIGERAAKAEIARIDKVAQAGGKVAAIDVDGPVRRLFYPDYPTSFAHGNMDIAWCVQQFIVYMKAVRKVHPHVEFYALTNFPNWGYKGGPAYWGADQDNKQYNWGDYWPVLKAIVEMTKEAGVPVRGLTVDNPYDYAIGRVPSPQLKDPASVDWLGRLRDMEDYVRKQGLEFNVIFNAQISGGDLSSEQVVGNGSMDQYYQDTLAFIKLYHERGGKPDRYIMQSWYKHPVAQEVLPEDKPPAFTALVKEVLEQVKQPR